MRTPRVLLVTLSLLATASAAPATTLVFENDLPGWQRLAAPEHVLDFEAASGELVGDEFADGPLAPRFELIRGRGLYSGDLAPAQVEPSSGVNVFGPSDCCSIEGIIRLHFESPVRSVGAFFFDVEADFSLTGFSTVLDAAVPDVAFSEAQGQSVQSFLGFVTDVPLSVLDIHFTTGPNIDGTVIDDLRYSTLPEPSTAVLLGAGLLCIFRRRSGGRVGRVDPQRPLSPQSYARNRSS